MKVEEKFFSVEEEINKIKRFRFGLALAKRDSQVKAETVQIIVIIGRGIAVQYSVRIM